MASRSLLVAAMALGGCEQLFGVDDHAAAPCTGITFDDGASHLAPLANGSDADPSLRDDEVELWIVVSSRLQVRTWSSDPGEFSDPAPVSISSDGLTATDGDPGLTADRRRVLFRSDRDLPGSPRLYEAIRPSVGAAFAPVALARGLEDMPVHGLDVTPDGLTVYVSEPMTDVVWRASRPSLDAPFGVPARVETSSGPLVAGFPSISADELEVYYHRPSPAGLVVRRRDAVTARFEGEVEVVAQEKPTDPDLSADGTGLVFLRAGAIDDDLAVLRRACD